MAATFYPFKFIPVLKEKIWGGDRIQHTLPDAPPTPHPDVVGEAWIVYDELVVANGQWQGKTLRELVKAHPDAIMGQQVTARHRDVFPLLVKFLDARDVLSIQVHPDDTYAQATENEPFGKCEVWYIMDAELGAQIIHGLTAPMTADQLRAAIEDGTLTGKVEYVEVAPGDIVLNMPGTIHAINKGMLVYEVQQSSDLTYRVFDWGRRQPDGSLRDLHIDKALDVTYRQPFQQHTIRPVVIHQDAAFTRAILCACAYFAVEKLDIRSNVTERPAGRCFHILTALTGAGELVSGGETIRLCPGETVLVPASVTEYTLTAAAKDETWTVLKSYVPDLRQDIITPLQAANIPTDQIIRLGGEPALSHLSGAAGE
ncbi:MAG: mannose-6-phosphate isomerase [Anaerolineae bacterium]|nr:mannose-6-phosphate isomerase [Anaerolineae bacterium]